MAKGGNGRMSLDRLNIGSLNRAIDQFPQVDRITADMVKSFSGVQQLVMLDRYAFKDTEKLTFAEGDLVVLTVKDDPKYPARGLGYVTDINWDLHEAKVEVFEDYRMPLEGEEAETGLITRSLGVMDKPLEVYYEQVVSRNARGLSGVEFEEKRAQVEQEFKEILEDMSFVPAGRVIYGAGSQTDVTFFNCYVMPYIKDSREGISDHRKTAMEIMSRGGGVGTNGSTLRPHGTLARGVNGKSSGSVSWLDDIAKLTNLVEQGGSRRGAQMIMMAD